MLTSNELELKANVSLGTLESNAEQLQEFVMARIQDYKPENYVGKAAEAKADRAVLNNAEKLLNSKRLELEREYMQPFITFKNTIAETCKAIKQASGALDEIVKAEENREKDVKRDKIANYWERQNFTLYPLEKIFDEKWLNKTAKQKDIEAEIDAKIKQTFTDLKILENFPAEEVPLLKTVYLETLNITDAMNKAEMLKNNRDRLAREKTERETIAARDALREQDKDETEEQKSLESNTDTLIAQALDIDEGPAIGTYALVLHGSKESLLKVKQYMTEWNVVYDKLVPKGNGVYAKE